MEKEKEKEKELPIEISKIIKTKKVKISVKDENGNLIKHRFAEVEVDSKGKTLKLPNGSLAIIRIIKEVLVKKAKSSKNESGILDDQSTSEGVKSTKKRKIKNIGIEQVGSPPTRSHTAKMDFSNDEKKSYKMTKKSDNILRPIPIEKKKKKRSRNDLDESLKVSEFDIDMVSLDTIKSRSKKKYRPRKN